MTLAMLGERQVFTRVFRPAHLTDMEIREGSPGTDGKEPSSNEYA